MLKPAIAITMLFVSAMAAQAGVSIGNDVIRTGTTIEVLGPGPDLQAIIDGITVGAAEKYVIKLGPGLYELNQTLVMKPSVSIAGSGQGTTFLIGGIGSGLQDATSSIVSLADFVSLTDLTIQNGGGSLYSYGIFNDADSARIQDVAVRVEGGTSTNWAVYNLNSSSSTLINVTAIALGGDDAVGVYNAGEATTFIHVNASATGTGDLTCGVLDFSSATIRDSVLEGSGGSIAADAIGQGGGLSTNVVNTQLIGGVSAGTFNCVGAYDANFAALNPDCTTPAP